MPVTHNGPLFHLQQWQHPPMLRLTLRESPTTHARDLVLRGSEATSFLTGLALLSKTLPPDAALAVLWLSGWSATSQHCPEGLGPWQPQDAAQDTPEQEPASCN